MDGRRRKLAVQGEVTVGELGAADVGMSREAGECRGGERKRIGNSRVMVSVARSCQDFQESR